MHQKEYSLIIVTHTFYQINRENFYGSKLYCPEWIKNLALALATLHWIKPKLIVEYIKHLIKCVTLFLKTYLYRDSLKLRIDLILWKTLIDAIW
jgi:hypothetical protein